MANRLRAWEHPTILSADSIKYLPALIIPAILALLASAIFTRIFTPRAYGVLALIGAATGPILVAVNQGFAQPVARYYAQYHQAEQTPAFVQGIEYLAVRISFGMLGLIGLLIGILAIGGLPSGFTWWLIGGAALGLWAASLVPVMMRQLQAAFHIREYRRLHIVGALLNLLFPLTLIGLFKAHIALMVWGSSLSSLVILVWVSRLTRTRWWRSPIKVVHYDPRIRSIVAQLVHFGLPLIPWFLIMSLLRTTDRYILMLDRGSAAVGIYNTTYILVAESVGLLGRLVMVGEWPHLMDSWARHQRGQTYADIRRITNVLLALGIGVIGFQQTFSQLAFHVLLGQNFSAGQHIVLPILLGMLIWAVCDVGHKIFELSNKTSLLLIPALSAWIVNLVLNVWLTPIWGVNAVAWDTFAAFGVYGIMLWLLSQWVWAWPLSLRTLAVLVTVGGISWGLAYHLIPGMHDFWLTTLVHGGAFLIIYTLSIGTYFRRRFR